MRKKKLLFLIPLAFAGLALFVAIGGLVVMHLWNWLLPPLFGWPALGFWQALGLLALCRILIGGLGGGHCRHGHMRGRFAERLERMSPEERENLRVHLHGRWGCVPPPAPAAPSPSGEEK